MVGATIEHTWEVLHFSIYGSSQYYYAGGQRITIFLSSSCFHYLRRQCLILASQIMKTVKASYPCQRLCLKHSTEGQPLAL